MQNLGTLLTSIAVPIIVPLVIRALSQRALADHLPGAASIELRYGAAMKALGVFGLALGLFIMVLPTFLNRHEFLALTPRGLVVALLTVPLGALMIFLFPETFLVRHGADTAGVTLGSVFRRPLRFTWQEIQSIDYSGAASWFVFRGVDGRVGRVSPLMVGLRTFAEVTLAHVDRTRFTELGWQKMSDAAAGRSLLT
jgi:ACR3 family arsenite efflux pump ArsB